MNDKPIGYRWRLCAVSALLCATAWAFPAPKITNVVATPTDGRKARVDVTYSLSEPAIVLADVAAVAGGKVRFRGFKGRYRLGWKDADGQRRFVEVSLK